jgi:hypothetical protein
VPDLDNPTAAVANTLTSYWCTPYNLPSEDNPGEEESYTKQHFARMWYDLLIDSDSFLGLTQGKDDPYSWTTGQGCGYVLKGERYPYTNEAEVDILHNASREVYYIDEGESIGVVDRNLIIGDAVPSVGAYNFSNPLKTVGVVQTLYAALVPEDLIERVKHCKRPGGPIVDLSLEDAEEVLYRWKEAMEEAWSEGWDDDDAGEVQFVFFADDSAVGGTTARMLEDITLSNNKLTIIAIIFIALFSAMFLFSFNVVESRVLITLIGVALVVLAYFAAIGFGLLVSIKVNITIAWTLPFIMIGLGVDDMYIVL